LLLHTDLAAPTPFEDVSFQNDLVLIRAGKTRPIFNNVALLALKSGRILSFMLSGF